MFFSELRLSLPVVIRRCLACKPYVVPKPAISNAFEEDPILSVCLKRLLPPTVYETVERDLSNFGEKTVNEIPVLSRQCEREKPQLEMFDCWGHQTNRLILSNAWHDLRQISAMEGLVAIPYESKKIWPKFAEFSRLFQLAKLYLYLPSSGTYGCPLAMTDGAAYLLEKLEKTAPSPVVTETLKRLTSREPELFWTSGQLMTEIKGGSDIGNSTETIAVPLEDNQYLLYGFKFFASAPESDVFIVSARAASGLKGEGVIPGNKGTSLFLVKARDETGHPNSLRMLRLKNKLGTHQLPTAEVVLDGALGVKLCDIGRGISEASNMLLITRYWSAVSSASSVRRMAMLARDYSTKRQTFGKTLNQHTLHVAALAQLEMEARAGLLLLMRMAQLMGLKENAKSTKADDNLLRVLMPLAKGYICKRAMPVLSEGLELFGGQGYMEDTDIPALFRDAQVQPIWEGTTNIQSIDLIRAVSKTDGAVLKALSADAKSLTADDDKYEIAREIEKLAESLLSPPNEIMLASSEAAARDCLMALGGFYSSALLFDFAKHSGRPADLEIAERYLTEGRLKWSSVPRLLKDGYYSPAKFEAVKEAIFTNHKKVVDKPQESCNKEQCDKGEACCGGSH